MYWSAYLRTRSSRWVCSGVSDPPVGRGSDCALADGVRSGKASGTSKMAKHRIGRTQMQLYHAGKRKHERRGPGSVKKQSTPPSGDNEARPDEIGSGPAHPTADATSLGAARSIRQASSDRFDIDAELRDIDGLEVVEATDGRLGLTNIGDVGPHDWAADTGDTKTPESESKR